MSSARRRGRARGRGQDAGSETSRGHGSHRGGPPQFDGPASRGSGSAGGSRPPVVNPPSGGTGPQGSDAGQSAAGSRRGSAATISQPPVAAGRTPTPGNPQLQGLDPAREGPVPRNTDAVRNVDIPVSFYNIDQLYALPTEFTARPGFNNTGKAIQLPVNAYTVTRFPNIKIYQYDVVIGNGSEKRLVMAKVWNSRKRRSVIGEECIFDGNKLAWSLTSYDQVKVMVDLDEEESGKPSKEGRNAFRLHMNQTKVLDLNSLEAYVNGRIQHDTNVLQAINFLDHLLREGPSRNNNFISIRRSFFVRNGQRADLGGGVEVFRGIYQSMRIAQGNKLIINLDVANTCFWKPQKLLNTIVQKNRWRDHNEIVAKFRNPGDLRTTEKYLRRRNVKANYPGNKAVGKVWTIDRIVSDKTAVSHKIAWRDPQTGKETGEQVSVAAYFKRRYNLTLQYPTLPLVQMTKKIKGEPIYFPAELLDLVENERYGTKLDEVQTAAMIKFAVAPPNTRRTAIEEGKSWLNWGNDKFLKNYGLGINQQQIATNARILPPPGILFGGGKTEQPGLRGRWDLRGKQFFGKNTTDLVSWGVGWFDGRTSLNEAAIDKFVMDFVKAYRQHGGVVANEKPFLNRLPQDAAEAVYKLHQSTGNKFQRRPQLLIFVVQDKNSAHYLRIKKSCECRFGVVSQVMQAAQVQKGNAQYYSNVLMKVNAKLGGCTSQVKPANNSGWSGRFAQPTMFIGADVSHASPGSEQPSMAALSVSFDRHAGRYAAGCQTNGHRVEMISQRTMTGILLPLIREWMATIGGGRPPQQVYYMRDGVGEGDYVRLINDELTRLRGVFDEAMNGKFPGKITVIVASKRHHIRAFPRAGDGDQKGNPVPGTLIERDVTMPNEWDFYLFSHIALQGTSRPVHYTVLKDEAKHSPAALQNMIYEHCYQYMRSTTSVSLHPAVYYAHLASNRSKAHEDTPASRGPTGGPGFKQNQPSSDTPRTSEATPLLPLAESQNRIQFAMWYI